MKLTEDNDKLVIFIINRICSKYMIDCDNKKILSLILKMQKDYDLDLKGFYRVDVYYHKSIGMIMEISKYDDLNIIDYTDFKIKIHDNYDFLLEFDDYFERPNIEGTIYYNDKFYIRASDISNSDITKYSDLYRIIYKINKQIIDEGIMI